MDQAELRIGNQVSFKGLWNGEVEEIRSGTIGIKGYDGVFPPDVFEGVPITKEILLMYGFTHRKCTGAGGQDEWAGLDFWEIDGECFFRGSPKYLHLVGYFNTQINYVHQLQNLYYAIKKKKLIIK